MIVGWCRDDQTCDTETNTRRHSHIPYPALHLPWPQVVWCLELRDACPALDADEEEAIIEDTGAQHDAGLQRQRRRGVVALEPIVERDVLCVALGCGPLLEVPTAGPGVPQPHDVEEVGSIQGGVAALRWSPDGDVVAVVSGLGRLLLLDQVGVV